jgi:hypothetical protein
MVFMDEGGGRGRGRIGACSWGRKGDQAREEISKKSFELTALLRSLSFGGTDEKSERSEKKRGSQSFFEQVRFWHR